MRLMAAVLPICAVLLSGCETSLTVSALDIKPPAEQQKSLPAGFLYRLPAALIRPTAFVAIRDCAEDEALTTILVDIKPADVKPVTEIKFVVGGAVSAVQVPDQAVLIDYRELQQFLKTSSISLERHPNGMLKSVNASLADQTPQAMASVAAALGSAALFATGAPIGAAAVVASAAGGPVKSTVMTTEPEDDKKKRVKDRIDFAACKPATVKLVSQRKEAAKQRAEITSMLDTITAEAAKIGAKPDADAAKLEALNIEKEKHSAQLAKVTAELSDIDAQLTLPLNGYSEGGIFTRLSDRAGQIDPSSLREGVSLTSANIDLFLARHFTDGVGYHLRLPTEASQQARLCREQIDESCSSISAIGKLLNKLAIVRVVEQDLQQKFTSGNQLSIPVPTSVIASANGIKPNYIEANQGVIYVEPKKIKVDMIAATIGPQSVLSTGRVIHTADISVPQLGRYLALPLGAGFGETSELSATFAEDGSLLTGSFAQPQESGLQLANSLKGLADTALSTRTSVEDRKLKLLKQRAEALTVAAGIQDTTKKLNPTTDPIDDLNSELARVTAEAAIAEAQLRLRAAQAKLLTP